MAKHRGRRFGQIETLPSGRYRARYTGPDRQRYTSPMLFDSLADAEAWLEDKQRSIRDGRWHESTANAPIRTSGQTLADYAAAWMDTRYNRQGEPLKPRTRAEYERLIAGPLNPLTQRRLESITPSMVTDWHRQARAEGRVTQTARAYSLLKSIMQYAVEQKRITDNPCKIRGAANATTGRKVEPPTPVELQKIVDAIEPRYKAAVLIAAWAGTRYGELTELRRKDIIIVREGGDVRSVVVNVSRGVTHVPGQGFIVGSTKSEAGNRSIALPPHIFGDVLTHLKTYTADFPDSLLFPARDGVTHLAESSFVKHWYPAREAAGRPDLPFHGLRHYGATRFAQTGATLKEIQARLGHSTVTAAMKYQHAGAVRDQELARRMSDLA